MSGWKTRLQVMAAVAALLAVGSPAAGRAQTTAVLGAVGVGYETYRFEDAERIGIRSLSLLVAPVATRVPLIGASTVELGGAFAHGKLERPDGSETILVGMVDTDLRLRVPLAGGSAAIHGVVSLPTGKATLTLEEAEIAGAIATDLFPTRISQWGAGGGAGMGLTVVGTVGGFALGAGASYLVAREFEPLEVDAFAYRPGNTLSLQVAADRNIGRAGKATLQVAMEHHEEDALNGANLYRAGRRYRVIGSYAFAAGARSSGIVYAGAQHRDRGRSAVDLLLDVPAQDLVVLGGGMRVPLGRITLTPNLDARLLRSDDGTAQGHITTAGAAVEVPLSRSIVAVPSLRARVGNLVVREGQESAMRGLDFALTLRSPVALRSPLTSR